MSDPSQHPFADYDPASGRTLDRPDSGGSGGVGAGGVRSNSGGNGGPSFRAILTWSVAVVLIALTFILQRPGAPDAEATERLVTGLDVPGVPSRQRLLIKIALAGSERGNIDTPTPFGAFIQPMIDAEAGFKHDRKGGLFAPPPAPSDPVVIPHRDQASAAGRLRAAMLAGAISGPGAALNRLELVEPFIDPASDLAVDVRLLSDHFRALAAADRDASPLAEGGSSESAVPDLLDRHGLFAAAALALVSDEAESQVESAANTGNIILLVLVLFGIGFAGVMLAGLVLCIIGLIGLSQGWVRFKFRDWIRRDELVERDRLIWVETLVVFLATFAGLKILLGALEAAKVNESILSAAGLFGQWLVLPSIFWPLARGVSWQRWKTHLGWSVHPDPAPSSQTAGQLPGAPAPSGSVLREAGAGLLGYCAWLFIYVCFALVWAIAYTLISEALGLRGPGGLQDNKVVDIFGGGGPFEIVMIVLLASIWAPVVEETIFRGVLFRHWRPRLGFFLSALATAAIFAALHGYGPAQLVMVAMLGVGFALIREWRGSIIGCAAAHGLHNFVVSVLMIVLFGILA